MLPLNNQQQQQLPQGYTRSPDGRILDQMGRPVNPALIQSYQNMRSRVPTAFNGQQQQQQQEQQPAPLVYRGGGL
jgi:hypothetical protein